MRDRTRGSAAWVFLLAACTGAGSGEAAPRQDDPFGATEPERVSPRQQRVWDRRAKECPHVAPGARSVQGQEALLRELVSVMKWIARARTTEPDVSIRSWCEWRIEREEGLRAAMPSVGPPPVADLPDASGLVGLSRARLLAELGPPGNGCWQQQNGAYRRSDCATHKHIEFPFYALGGGPGGGEEVWLDFDDDGVCVRARWMRTQ